MNLHTNGIINSLVGISNWGELYRTSGTQTFTWSAAGYNYRISSTSYNLLGTVTFSSDRLIIGTSGDYNCVMSLTCYTNKNCTLTSGLDGSVNLATKSFSSGVQNTISFNTTVGKLASDVSFPSFHTSADSTTITIINFNFQVTQV